MQKTALALGLGLAITGTVWAQEKEFPELVDIVGTMSDGWAPRALKGFRRGMKPAEVGRLMPGAEKVKYGFSIVEDTRTRGIVKYKFSYLSEKSGDEGVLTTVEITFDPQLCARRSFYRAAASLCMVKYGEADLCDVAKGERVTWNGPFQASACLRKVMDTQGEYELAIHLPERIVEDSAFVDPRSALPDLSGLIGPAGDEWNPKALAGLRRGMRPEDAGKHFRGADRIHARSRRSVIWDARHPAVVEFNFTFRGGKGIEAGTLSNVLLTMDPYLGQREEFYAALFLALVERYGTPAERSNRERAVWKGPNEAMIVLCKDKNKWIGVTLEVVFP